MYNFLFSVLLLGECDDIVQRIEASQLEVIMTDWRTKIYVLQQKMTRFNFLMISNILYYK
jgi:hypothetical protein